MRRSICTLAIAAVIAAAAGYWLPLDDLRKLAPAMVALFGVLTGFLVNAMIRTATALEGTLSLSSSELREIAGVLKGQQAGWRQLFHIYLTIILVIIIGALVPTHWVIAFRDHQFDLSMAGVGIFFGFVAIVLIRTRSVVDGISALQDLRSKLLIGAAEKREREERSRASNEIGFKPGPIDPDFGRKVAFPGR